jgi:hypothetical protein
MGTGIMAAIPIILEPYDKWWGGLKMENFSKGFFDNFDVKEAGSKTIYTMKENLLIDNYKAFLIEFYTLIEEDFDKETDLTFDTIPSVTNLDEFREAFSVDKLKGYLPLIWNDYRFFSILGCQCHEYWLFYSGSRKVILEEYMTFLHFEKVLSKSMTNPLGNVIKFGMFG